MGPEHGRAASAQRFAVAVVGPGALGTLFARRLSAIVPTALVGRDTARLPQADWVILAVKAYDTAAAVSTAYRMKPQAIVSLQNGLVGQVPQGVTTAAAYRDGRRVVEVATGKTLLPPGFGALARLLRRAGLDATVVRDIRSARLRKLLANVCLNPVTAVFGVRNGAVRKPPYDRFVEALAREAASVLAAEGLKITAAQAMRGVMDVAKVTARNRSSMLQDVMARRRTEIDYLTGALLQMARRNRVSVPTHAAFHRLVHVMEGRIESAAPGRQPSLRRPR